MGAEGHEGSAAEAVDPNERTRVVDPTTSPRASGERDMPARIGRFEIRGALGAGGMGQVWRAFDPELSREVALKQVNVDLLGHGGHQALIREGQSLAALNHPNVVEVFDVTLVDEGIVVAMELVDGPTLRQWLDTPRSWREVLEVFVQAGRGLEAAHRAGLVHRDFKPTNVLIGIEAGGTRVRVADFGLADAMMTVLGAPGRTRGSSSSSGSSLSDVGLVVGTAAYMAPEQHAGELCDARTDQFAFCVALFEALWGVRPYRGADDSALMAAKSTGPPRPPRSPRVPRWLAAAVLRGLASKPDDRWPDLAALLARLEAAPRARARAVRWVGVAGAVMAAAFAWTADPGGAQRCRADDLTRGAWGEADRAAVREALVGIDRPYAAHTATAVVDRLQAYASTLEAEAEARCEMGADDPARDDLTACLRQRVDAFQGTVDVLRRRDAAVLDHAVELVGRLPSASSCSTATSGQADPVDPELAAEVRALRRELDELAAARVAGVGRGAAPQDTLALTRTQEIAARAEALAHAPLRAKARLVEAGVLEDLGRLDAARESLETAYYIAIEHALHEHEAAAAGRLLALLEKLSDYDGAQTWAERLQVVADRRRDPQLDAEVIQHLATLDVARGDYGAAIEKYERAIDLLRALRGPDDLSVAAAMFGLGSAAGHAGDYRRELELEEEVRRIYESAYGPGHPAVAVALNALGIAEYKLGNYEGARTRHLEAVEILDELVEVDQRLADSLANAGIAEWKLGNYGEARALLDRSQTIYEDLFGSEHPRVAAQIGNLANVAQDQGDLALARRLFERALVIFETSLGRDHPLASRTVHNIGTVLVSEENFEEAVAYFERALASRMSALGPGHPDVGETHLLLGRALIDIGRHEDAETHLRDALAIFESAEAEPELVEHARAQLERLAAP